MGESLKLPNFTQRESKKKKERKKKSWILMLLIFHILWRRTFKNELNMINFDLS